MKKLKTQIITTVAVCLGVACGSGIVAFAHEKVSQQAHVDDGFVYTDSTEQELVTDFYYNEEDGNCYIDPDMTVVVPHKDKSEYGVNENGETYGISADVFYYEDTPDLIKAMGDNGIEGYVRKTELMEEEPASPEEAIKMQEERIKNGNPPKVINVYESDGVTVIDTMTTCGGF